MEDIFVYPCSRMGLRLELCGMRTCVICDFGANDEHARKGKRWTVPGISGSVYVCGRCESILLVVFSEPWRREKRDKAAPGFGEWLAVLKNAWDSASQCFRCQISGARLHIAIDDEGCSSAPDWDHDENGQYIVVAAGLPTAHPDTT